MKMFKIISLEDFDSICGKINKGDEINCIKANNIKEAKMWAYNQYGTMGENIKHKVVEVKE